jgi:hypothetical protein
MIAGHEARPFQPSPDETDLGFETTLPALAMFFNLQSAIAGGCCFRWHKKGRTPVKMSGLLLSC